jgi:V8-like Glu-specific endopeptidase
VKIRARVVAVACLFLGLSSSAWATPPVRFEPHALRIDSGHHDGSGDRFREAFTMEVQTPGAPPVMRVKFEAANLGARSYITIRSLKDQGEQRLDARTFAEWGGSSAYINGDRALVRLHVAPDDREVYVRIAGVIGIQPTGALTQCDATDDRVATNDNKECRLNLNCTGWRIGNGAFLTAGHCVDYDPDNTGPMLPDGVLDVTDATVVEFRVPASDAAGNPVAADPNDQYTVIASSVQWRFDGDNQGLGKDWAVFRVRPNSNTHLLPHQVYGLPFRITHETPSVGSDLRVTGFGTDTGTANQTNQTATGPFQGETTNGNDIRIDHRVDSESGNSGSPIIWGSFPDLAIGIHTNGGCTTTGGNNSGTSFEVDALENAINAVPGPNTVYVDGFHPVVPVQEGTLMRPLSTVLAGINQVVSGGRVSIFSATYSFPAGGTVSKPMTIEAPVGGVTIIGQ